MVLVIVISIRVEKNWFHKILYNISDIGIFVLFFNCFPQVKQAFSFQLERNRKYTLANTNIAFVDVYSKRLRTREINCRVRSSRWLMPTSTSVRSLFVLRNRRNADATEFNRPRTVARAQAAWISFLSRVISPTDRAIVSCVCELCEYTARVGESRLWQMGATCDKARELHRSTIPLIILECLRAVLPTLLIRSSRKTERSKCYARKTVWRKEKRVSGRSKNIFF